MKIDWQLISTAPKDGTGVLLWLWVDRTRPISEGYPQIGRWRMNSLFGETWDFGDNGSCDPDVATHWAVITPPE
jgi:hypothetical protein